MEDRQVRNLDVAVSGLNVERETKMRRLLPFVMSILHRGSDAFKSLRCRI